MCPYLPDLFVCVSQIFAELKRLVIESNYQRPSRGKQGRGQLEWKWFIYWGQGGEIHIFGCIYKLSIWVKDFWWLCKPNKCTTTRPIQVYPLHWRRKRFWHFWGNAAIFLPIHWKFATRVNSKLIDNDCTIKIWIIGLLQYPGQIQPWCIIHGYSFIQCYPKPNFAMFDYSWIS